MRRREATLEPLAARAGAWSTARPRTSTSSFAAITRKPGAEVPRRFLEVFGGPVPVAEAGQRPLGAGSLDDRFGRPASGAACSSIGSGSTISAGDSSPRPDDFGKMGQPPTHPELLDYLAAEFIRSGWSIKHMQRLMVLSSAYRMSSRDADPQIRRRRPGQPAAAPNAASSDWKPRRFATRFSPFPAGSNERLEGPSVPVHLDEFMTGRGRPRVSGPLDGDGRRSIYLAVRRNFLQSDVSGLRLSATGDDGRPPRHVERSGAGAGAAEQSVCRRSKRGVGRGGSRRRSISHTGPSDDALIDRSTRRPSHGFRRRRGAGCRQAISATTVEPASNPERRTHGRLADLCHVLLNVKEFIYVEVIAARRAPRAGVLAARQSARDRRGLATKR